MKKQSDTSRIKEIGTDDWMPDELKERIAEDDEILERFRKLADADCPNLERNYSGGGDYCEMLKTEIRGVPRKEAGEGNIAE